jgi:hypothetical protein
MQTFLPYPDFRKSLECLDNRRLGKQRVEAMQIIHTIERGNRSWSRHPAVLMWKKYVPALRVYHDLAIIIWEQRGFQNNMELLSVRDHFNYENPAWLGNEKFHRSHQSNLVRKLAEHYRKFFPDVPDDLPYVWPEVCATKETREGV